MGVPINNVTRRVVYAASGTGPYNFTFEILAATDIAVYRDDTLLTLTTNYTVTINANGTGSVTLTASPTGATQIAIVGNRTIQRTTDFVTGGDFFANTLNDELDQQTIFSQQNAEGLQRALSAPQTDPTTINMTLPGKAVRANSLLRFDADGNPSATAFLTTGTGSLVLQTSPTLITPNLGTPSAGVLTSCTGLPISTGVSGLGSGVTTVLGATANSGGVVSTGGVATLSNKRIDIRVSSAASATTITPDISTYDMYALTALASSLTINAPIGTPVDGSKLMFRILDNGSARSLTWNATFTAIGVIIPTSTVSSKTVYVGAVYNAAATRWDVIAAVTQ